MYELDGEKEVEEILEKVTALMNREYEGEARSLADSFLHGAKKNLCLQF